MSDADRAEPEIGVAQHHPLGPAGRARGVEQGGEIVGIAVRRAQPLAARKQGRAFRFVDRRAIRRQIAFAEPGEPRRA
jgi:hypothetical protein